MELAKIITKRMNGFCARPDKVMRLHNMIWHKCIIRLDHQPPHRLAAKFQVMDFGQLLVSEGGSKIGVAGLQQGERTFLGLGIELVVTGLSAFLREQPRGTKPAIAFQQPLDLADAETQLLGGLTLFDLALVESAHDLHTPKFFLAHLENVAHFLPYPFL